ncbi:MarR family winged helix-turn-helix transcriptional regulator [Streptomyces sp. NPDC049954]|uniref:MarR family winged helix-turn-helix transcriptional regulator n=1 Tax=Streptomyces sp. NPDC049954 TaxID=3155779 RepID=UPI0034296759
MVDSSGSPEFPQAESDRVRPVAFLLTQIGEHVALEFSQRIAAFGLTAPQAGLLRLAALYPGDHQREFARRLGLTPSRIVAFVDVLQERDLLERRRNAKDRRFQGLFLTPQGEEVMRELGKVVLAQDEELCAGLDPEDRRRLSALLRHVAGTQGLVEGIHPGYRRLRSAD